MKEIKNNDKIYEAYVGELGKEMQNKVKERFLWMSNMIEGEEILDVGCSSGIFDILLGREGKIVTGVDIDIEAINKANELKGREGTLVQKNINFICDSINEYKTEKKYDTIILSEVLEHMFYPDKIISKVDSMLKEKGALVITLPFGVNSYFDHKKSYFIADVLNMVNRLYSVSNIEYFGEWIGVKCVSKNSNGDLPIDTNFLKKFEMEILKKESKLEVRYLDTLDELKKQSSEIVNLKIEIEKVKVLNEYLQSQLDDNKVLDNLVKENKQMEFKLKLIEDEKEKMESKENLIKNENDRYKGEIINLKKQLAGMNNRKVIKLIRKFNKVKSSVFDNYLVSMFRKRKNSIKNVPKINMNFYNDIDNLIKNVPNSNGSNYYDKIDIKIGIITDEYMFNYYKDAVELIYIDYNNYKEELKDVDLLLFVSCWHGMKNNDWRGMTSKEGVNRVIEVFQYAKSLNLKTIFQTIEDPSNYSVFLPIANEADYIFTTALEMVDKYIEDTNNKNVFLLDYGINPQFHNPVGFKNDKIKKKDNVFFAGSWAPRYKERCDDAVVLFDGVIESNKRLILADRNYDIKGYEFPTKYYEYIIPAIEHEKLQKVHKLFDWSLNLNSIKYSPTMCAMRVYELQALGNLMISNYSMAVNNQFPNIFMAKSPFEVAQILSSYNDIDVYKMQVDGIRNVMSNHTVYDKLDYIFDKINIESYKLKKKSILVICDNINTKITETFNKQSYEEKVLVEIKDVNNELLEKFDYVAYFNEKNMYQENYLTDMINAFKYTDSDFVTILSEIKKDKILGINHDYVIESNRIDLTILDTKKYDIREVLKSNKINGKGYSIDPFQITDLNIAIKEKPILSVIVPVYNNGKYLLNKCFNSLYRSSIFNQMEIILVDDGSEKETIEIIKKLDNVYSNVKTFFFDDGGSGSASRPRNKGVELATTDYITYLDPDNEAINDGYAKLLDIILKDKYDFVFGSIIKLSDKESVLKYYKEDMEILNPKDELISKNFKTNSIQAAIIKKELIVKNKIQNPVGAAGQDSLFFQELMINAKTVFYHNLPIHIYYASRNDSIVNSISHKFFDKFLIMEKYQVKKLKEYGLLDEYKERRYYYFLDNWYLEKLKLVKTKEEYNKSIDIIHKIQNLYGDNNNVK